MAAPRRGRRTVGVERRLRDPIASDGRGPVPMHLRLAASRECAKAKGRVHLFCQINFGKELVPAEIKRANRRRVGRHFFNHFPICLEVLFFGGKRLAIQVQEFCSV